MPSRASFDAALTAQNTFTPTTSASRFYPQTWFNVSVEGTFVGTVTLQRSYDSGLTWYDVQQWTAATESIAFNAEDIVWWRLGFKTSDYSSGTANVRISQ